MALSQLPRRPTLMLASKVVMLLSLHYPVPHVDYGSHRVAIDDLELSGRST
jgi:hypothetical protein